MTFGLMKMNNRPFEPGFDTANELMLTISELLPNISPVTLSDIALFNQFFIQESNQGKSTHGNGFTYIGQMMNSIGPKKGPQLGYKYYDGTNLIPIVTYPKRDNPEEVRIYFIRPMGPDSLEKVVSMTTELRKQGFTQPAYAKKIFLSEKEILLKAGFKPIESYPWHHLALAEDDTLPEQIFDTQTTLQKVRQFGRRTSLRTSQREVNNLLKYNTVEVVEENFEEVAWPLTKNYFESWIVKEGKPNVSTPYDYYNMIFHNPPREGLIRKLIYVNGVPQGYYVLENVPGTDTSNLYALITLREYKSIADFGIFHMFENSPTKFINMGGSEDAGINKFKLKYQPVQQNPMQWAVNLV